LKVVRWRASRFLVKLDLGGGATLIGHAILGQRRIADGPGAAFIGLFDAPRTAGEAAARAGIAPEAAARLVSDLADFGWLVADGTDEDAAVVARVHARARRGAAAHDLLGAIEDEHVAPAPLSLAEGEPVSLLVLGMCSAQAAAPAVEAEARSRGLRAKVQFGLCEDVHLVGVLDPDVVVLQLAHRVLLAPLLDGLDAISPTELRLAAARAAAEVERAVAAAAAATKRGLLLVQGVAAPQTSPLGARDARHDLGAFDAVAVLNRAARRAAAAAGALFIDEDALFARHGKAALLDDLVAPFSHHGVTAAGHALVARAWLDAWELSRRRGAVRLVVVDLDGTLWPGEVAAPDWSMDSGRLVVPLLYERFAGLHEVLGILKRRGILLAVASKNTEAVVRARWRPELLPPAPTAERDGARHVLGPDDFVALKIDWRPKSEMIRELAGELGVPLEAIAFIDDHPVEREEVRRMLPAVLVLGADARATLLTSPRFDATGRTPEAARRTETTRARLERDAAERSAMDRQAFLGSLGVRCRVRLEEEPARLARVAELLERTTQFNTSGRRYTADELAALRVVTLDCADRFADYGLTGAAVLDGDGLSVFALSCRVIGLEVEGLLLRRAVEVHRARATAPLRVVFVPTDRNLPATRLVALAGGAIIAADAPLPPLPAHCTVE
jgi:FkbH-like protein